jgi:ribose transport system ATP-binding protein
MLDTAQAPRPSSAPATGAAAPYRLEMRGITKAFPGVQALDNVELLVRPGEVHALVGENGAGKSTLMKILTGAYQADHGEIRLRGQTVEFHNPHQARSAGIAMVHQELNLVPDMTAAQNLFLGTNEGVRRLGIVDWRVRRQRARAVLGELGLVLDVDVPVRALSVAHQQMIEIAKVLSMNADVLVMDEPTSSLTDREIERLYEVTRALKQRGVSIIYISHRLDEIFDLSDRVTVLRDGCNVTTEDTADMTMERLVRLMVGRDISQIFRHRPAAAATLAGERVALRVEGLSTPGLLRDVSFEARHGEILGLAGLMGAGRTELVRAIFGADPIESGTIYVEGQRCTIKQPRDAIRLGIGLVPEDRKTQGLILDMAVANNCTLTILNRISRWGVLRMGKRQGVAEEYVQRLAIKTPSTRQIARYLSGGNQQKVVISKWLASDARILIFDEPTRGIDVGAKLEVRGLLEDLARQGACVILISSELPEILGMCDRVLVLHEGRVAGEFDAAATTEEEVLHAASGLTLRAAAV